MALLVGYLIGGTPTADWLARRAGIDLRTSGSGNPGANNALRLGGRGLAIRVLLAEVLKGVACVVVGGVIAGQAGMVLGGIGAVAGNVFNPYRRLRGGQGLAITAGVLCTATPAAGLAGIAAIAVAARILHRSAPAAIIALLVVVVVSAWLPMAPWGMTDPSHATLLAGGVAAVVAPKQISKLRPASRPPTPATG